MLPPTIRTARLLLDAVTAADAASVAEFCSDPELQRYVPVPMPYTRAHAEHYCDVYARSAAEGDGALWAIRWADVPGPLIGVIELKPEPLASAELGFWLGAPHRGGRIMTEAALAVCDRGFAPGGMGLSSILWQAVMGNLASASVARRCGFHFEGMSRSGLTHRGERVDGWCASLLATDPRRPEPGWPEGIR